MCCFSFDEEPIFTSESCAYFLCVFWRSPLLQSGHLLEPDCFFFLPIGGCNRLQLRCRQLNTCTPGRTSPSKGCWFQTQQERICKGMRACPCYWLVQIQSARGDTRLVLQMMCSSNLVYADLASKNTVS